MSKRGLDPNASFRHPVDTTPAPCKILVDVDTLEYLMNKVPHTPMSMAICAELQTAIATARKAQEAHRAV